MNRKKSSVSISTMIMITLCAVCGTVWCCSVLWFLRSNMMVRTDDVILNSLLTAGASVSIYGIFRLVSTRLKSEYKSYVIMLALFSAVYAFIVIITPYSPNHDSYDLEIILKAMKTHENIGDYLKAYMNFFVTNKLVVYIYYPFVTLFNDVQLGVRIANGVFIWVSSVCISIVSGHIRSIRTASLSLIVMLFLCPMLLFSGPYIYPPAIMLSALALMLYMNKEPVIRVFGYLFAGMLFTVRPMSLGVFLVYVVCKTFYNGDKKKYKLIRTAVNIVFVFAVCFVTQWYIGKIMYVTGAHPLEKLDSAMGLWTIEVGTRDQGTDTGFCKYSPVAVEPEKIDSISQNFFDLWLCYIAPDDRRDEIKDLKSRITLRLKERVQKNIVNSPESFGNFFVRKYTNYYRDYYKPYFYSVNINSKNNKELLYKNYDYRYCLYENSLLFIFYILGALAAIKACVRVYRKKTVGESDVMTLVLFFGVICTSVMSILFTEVGKRLIFDSFVPMCIVICSGLSVFDRLYDFGKGKNKKVSEFSVVCVTAAVCFAGLYYLYKDTEISLFKDCSIDIDSRNVTLTFDKPIEKEGYVYIDGHSEEFSMKGWDKLNVEYGSTEYIAKPVYFSIRLPDGQLVYISYLE